MLNWVYLTIQTKWTSVETPGYVNKTYKFLYAGYYTSKTSILWLCETYQIHRLSLVLKVCLENFTLFPVFISTYKIISSPKE